MGLERRRRARPPITELQPSGDYPRAYRDERPGNARMIGCETAKSPIGASPSSPWPERHQKRMRYLEPRMAMRIHALQEIKRPCTA